MIFHNGSSYDYHFIIKELVEEFARPFKCLKEIHHFFSSNGEKNNIKKVNLKVSDSL